MANEVIIGSAEFKVDLAAMSDAIGVVSSKSSSIRTDLTSLQTLLTQLQSDWQSPAGLTYSDLSTSLNTAATSMETVLDGIVSRLGTTYENYVAMETTNASTIASGL